MKLQLKKQNLINLSQDTQLVPLTQTALVAGGQGGQNPQSSYPASVACGTHRHVSDQNTFCMISGDCDTYTL